MYSRVARIFLPPPSGDGSSDERARNIASIRTLWVGIAIALDLTLYAVLRHAPGVRPEIVRLFAFVNVGLMALDLALTRLALVVSRRWRRPLLTACILCETLAATVWIQMTGSVSSYFLIMGFLLIAVYRLLCDYASGLTSAASMALFHMGVFALEAAGALRPASLFATAPLGIYETPLFRTSAMTTLLVGYGLTFLAMNFFATTLREKDAALRNAQRDLARAVDETVSHGRLCGMLLADRYELTELLGRGGMGEVYQARRTDDGLSVAVKVLHQHLADRKELRERFRREALLLTRISPGHVAKVHECGVTNDGQEYIVMEHLRGEDLGTRLRRRGRIAIDEAVPLVERIAVALEAAHAAGIVHRDLKPENVFLLEGNDDVRLLDFGIAHFQGGDGLTLTMELLGTPGYIAPEQVRSDGKPIGPETDVFALGVLVYRAITGKNAFPSRSPAAAVYESLHMTPPPPSSIRADIESDVDDVLALAMAKRREDRYRTPGELAAELRLAARGALGESTRTSARRLLQPEVTVADRAVAPTMH